MRFGSSLSTYTLSNMQVEKNNEATTYEPYITPITKQLSLGDKELFEDSFISYENGDFYFNDNFIRYIGKVTFSSFDTTYNRCSGSYSISAPGLTNTVTSAYCTTLQFVTGSIYKTNPNGTFQVRGQATTNSFHLWLDNITTEEQARTYLSNTDFNIVSATKEPIKTKITEIFIDDYNSIESSYTLLNEEMMEYRLNNDISSDYQFMNELVFNTGNKISLINFFTFTLEASAFSIAVVTSGAFSRSKIWKRSVMIAFGSAVNV